MEKVAVGQKVYIRKIQDADTPSILSWRNNDAVRLHFIYRDMFTKESHEKWLRNVVDTQKADQFIICDNESDAPLGSVYIRDIDTTHHKGEYGIFLSPDTPKGCGIGTEAAKLVIHYAFEQRGLHRLFLRVFADNIPAIKSYEKAGFTKEAYLKDDVFIDGKYHDIILMAILADAKEEEKCN